MPSTTTAAAATSLNTLAVPGHPTVRRAMSSAEMRGPSKLAARRRVRQHPYHLTLSVGSAGHGGAGPASATADVVDEFFRCEMNRSRQRSSLELCCSPVDVCGTSAFLESLYDTYAVPEGGVAAEMMDCSRDADWFDTAYPLKTAPAALDYPYLRDRRNALRGSWQEVLTVHSACSHLTSA